MEAEEPIDHIGVVLALLGDGEAKVEMFDKEGCDTCAAAKLCNAAGGNGKTELTAALPVGSEVKVGDKVIVRGTEAIHHKAILIATVIPCLALIAVMGIVFILTLSQGIAAIAGLGSMFLFFLLLYLFRNRLSREFRFTIVKKMTDDVESPGAISQP